LDRLLVEYRAAFGYTTALRVSGAWVRRMAFVRLLQRVGANGLDVMQGWPRLRAEIADIS